MARPELQPRVWLWLPRHRKARNEVEWVAWDVVAGTEHDGVSQYLPTISRAEQEALEMYCIDEGAVYRETDDLKKYYCNVGRIIGACSGVLTDFVFAEWNRSAGGEVHGRPISVRRLREMQVAIRG